MPKTIEIKQPSKLRDVLRIFSALDKARWSNTDNYNLINNIIFRDGLFSPHLGAIPKTWDMPRTIHAIHTQMAGPNDTFYPEQLDVTFDFVPRMCAKLQCRRCVFGGGIGKLCHQQRGFCCPVILAACGYFFPCDPDACTFKPDSVCGLCQSPFAK